jgi:hypothetical protein
VLKLFGLLEIVCEIPVSVAVLHSAGEETLPLIDVERPRRLRYLCSRSFTALEIWSEIADKCVRNR